ncbi:protein HOMOLOG OF MAMMALIAN LYST-INTERACTING PROTEIN 5-like [Andrographis paniculata]|uniref:protein HOMOLOG OF MAMMALIAN LYST-INTERACTING PROTEIN 5-like n=1 Tax=Andrographis paniculata TaxID=175694 RepID=UPI0021E97F39|nr:protein HOMOLOG OF MAMMALIAN LYST-INTERACTING PROTEIN 5-like [Andrographis paniculata]
MATDNEPAKLLLPYLQRADELQKHEPLVAYYCRLYAMELGLKIPQSDRTKTTNALLVSLMKQLEKDKSSLKLAPDDHLHLEGFASNVFAKADKQDRAGRADLNTAKTFYAASIFFEILNQFGELQPDLEQKQKYAVWKAADIRKALKEGREPHPGPPDGGDHLGIPSNTSSVEYDLGTSRGDDPAGPDLTRVNSATKTSPDLDSSPQGYDKPDFHHPAHTPTSPSFTPTTPSPSLGISPSPNYPTDNYPSENVHQQPTPSPSPAISPMNNSEHSFYHQPYSLSPYQPELQQHLPQQYPLQDASPLSYPNFQSYPSFSDSSLPAAPTHYPSYYQGSEASYPAAHTSAFPPAQHNSSGRNESLHEAVQPPTQEYEQKSNYQPPPEKIAEAHKAARFAVGALAFDDVSIAVDYLKKSLDLLTKPSAGH